MASLTASGFDYSAHFPQWGSRIIEAELFGGDKKGGAPSAVESTLVPETAGGSGKTEKPRSKYYDYYADDLSFSDETTAFQRLNAIEPTTAATLLNRRIPPKLSSVKTDARRRLTRLRKKARPPAAMSNAAATAATPVVTTTSTMEASSANISDRVYAIRSALQRRRAERDRLLLKQKFLQDNWPSGRGSEKLLLLHRQLLRDVQQALRDAAVKIESLERREDAELRRTEKATKRQPATIPPDKFQERIYKHVVDDFTDTLGLTHQDGKPQRDDYISNHHHGGGIFHGHNDFYYPDVHYHSGQYDELVYLLGPLARAVRILTWQVIAYLYYYVFIPFSEGATELAWAAFYYGTTGFLAYLSELAYEVACLLHIDHFIYGSSGFYGGGFRPGFAHIGHNPFPAGQYGEPGSDLFHKVDHALYQVKNVVSTVGHAVHPVVEAAIPVGQKLKEGVHHEVIRFGKPLSLSRRDFVYELIVWFRRAIWFMLYTGAVTLSPQIIVLTLALACIFEIILRHGDIDHHYLHPSNHHQGYSGHRLEDAGVAGDVSYYDDIGNLNYVDDDFDYDDYGLKKARTVPGSLAETMAEEAIRAKKGKKYNKYKYKKSLKNFKDLAFSALSSLWGGDSDAKKEAEDVTAAGATGVGNT